MKEEIKKAKVIPKKKTKSQKTHQGIYIPANPRKYKGTLPITYRSAWELKFCKYLDTHSGVLSWTSESVIIPYYHPIKRRMARYYPDFTMAIRNREGKVINYLIEIKPDRESRAPVPKKGKRKKTIIYEQTTWAVNEAKWKAAAEICKKRGWEFKILTEYEIFNKKRKN